MTQRLRTLAERETVAERLLSCERVRMKHHATWWLKRLYETLRLKVYGIDECVCEGDDWCETCEDGLMEQPPEELTEQERATFEAVWDELLERS